MRTFHTYIKACGVAYGGHAGSVGRVHPSCVHTPASLGKKDKTHILSPRSFNGFSTTDLMIRSLEDGLLYVRRQIEGLSDSEVILREMLLPAQSAGKDPLGSYPTSKRKFFFESLSSITEGEHKSFPLFGYGHESPMRIHLRINAKRITETLSPVPLLSQASYRSVCLTLGLNEEVERRITEVSINEILNLMLATRSKEDRLLDLFSELDLQRKQTQLLPDNKKQPLPSFFETLKHRFRKSVLPRTRPVVPV
jgi:hypothetical protein